MEFFNSLMNMQRFLSLVLYLVVLVVVWSSYDSTDVRMWLEVHVRDASPRAMFVYVFMVALLTAMAVPRQLCSFFGGYAFGLWEGTILATCGTGISCALCFLYARFVGQAWLYGRFADKLAFFDTFLCQSPFYLTLAVRIIPLGSNFLTNFLAGISRIPALPFLGASVLGFVVQNFIFALMGSGVQVEGGLSTLLSVVLYVFSLSLGYWIYRRYRKQ